MSLRRWDDCPLCWQSPEEGHMGNCLLGKVVNFIRLSIVVIILAAPAALVVRVWQ